MFQLTKTPAAIWWPVTVKWPNSSKPGDTVDMTFKVQFEVLPQSEGRAIDEALTEAEMKGDTSQRNTLMLRVVKNWDEDVVDEDGKPIPFSRDALEAALEFSWVRIGLNQAWTAFVNGDPRKGN